MPPGRTFSFETDDERALSANDRGRQDHQYELNTQYIYHDSPSRDIISPPPQYRSLVPPEPTDSETAYRPSSQHSPTRSVHDIVIETPRRPSAAPYDEDFSPPPPPPHRSSPTRTTLLPVSVATSEMDNSSEGSQEGGLGRAAADRHQIGNELYLPKGLPTGPSMSGASTPDRNMHDRLQRPSARLPERTSYASNIPLTAGAATPGTVTPVSTPDVRSSRYSGRSIPLSDYSAAHLHSAGPYANYHDSPYQSSSLNYHASVSAADINPYNIADDGDDGFMPEPKRKSVLPMSRDRKSAIPGGAVAGAAGGLSSMFGSKSKNVTSSGSYDPVADGQKKPGPEKSEWLSRQSEGSHRTRWVAVAVLGVVVVLAIIGGIAGGVLGSRHSSSGSSTSSSSSSYDSAADDTAANGDLDINSSQIKALMNNKNLHKVFPGIDYTPWGTQYPLCHTYPPSQNNVTRDMAVLSQLTNTVRLYGTDCNQTEMVLHAIDRLKLTNMKVWLGVWIDTNATTTARQLDQMYKILENVSDKSIFKGAIIGNEALYRAGEDKAQSETELVQILTDVKSNFTTLKYDLPVATSDLGDNWNAQLVAVTDYVMSNIHPFFAGVTADVASGWTWNFWQNHDVTLTASLPAVGQVISETGWPSGGGKDCGGSDGSCATGQSGSVASVDNMNTFMADWVCQALANGTDYFWFEAFDEPWKVVYNTAEQQWEDKWGLMDPGRNLKPGIKIPDCGGKTVQT